MPSALANTDLEASNGSMQSVEVTEWDYKRCAWTKLCESFADQYASVMVFLRILCFHYETLMAVVIAAASPCFYYFYTPNGKAMAFDISWTIVTLAAAFPLTMTLTAVFQRREAGLIHMSDFKANILSIFLAHRDWDWWTLSKQPSEPSTSGRLERLPKDHVASVHKELKRTVALARKVLVAPIISRTRHYYSQAGRLECKVVGDLTSYLHRQMAEQFHKLSIAGEEMKKSGLPANEAARLRQYLSALMAAWNKLRVLKNYRTPLGLRSFSRIYIFVTPIMFGPYYVYLAGSTNLGFAVALSIMTTLAMQGLFNLRYALEDPFDTGICRDAIDVHREMAEVEADLDVLNYGVAAAAAAAAAESCCGMGIGMGMMSSLPMQPGMDSLMFPQPREYDPRPSWASGTSALAADMSFVSAGL